MGALTFGPPGTIPSPGSVHFLRPPRSLTESMNAESERLRSLLKGIAPRQPASPFSPEVAAIRSVFGQPPPSLPPPPSADPDPEPEPEPTREPPKKDPKEALRLINEARAARGMAVPDGAGPRLAADPGYGGFPGGGMGFPGGGMGFPGGVMPLMGGPGLGFGGPAQLRAGGGAQRYVVGTGRVETQEEEDAPGEQRLDGAQDGDIPDVGPDGRPPPAL
jgi:hypothetical protein